MHIIFTFWVSFKSIQWFMKCCNRETDIHTHEHTHSYGQTLYSVSCLAATSKAKTNFTDFTREWFWLCLHLFCPEQQNKSGSSERKEKKSGPWYCGTVRNLRVMHVLCGDVQNQSLPSLHLPSGSGPSLFCLAEGFLPSQVMRAC